MFVATIRFVNLTKKFGAVTAVNDLSLSVGDGEFIALLGPSGCGKTTTLRLLAGLEAPTSGQVFIGERDVTTLPPRERDVAMVFQDYALYPHMTIFENIAYPLKVRHRPKPEQQAQVTEVASLLQIGHLLERRPGQLSGGQQQRVSVARAVVYRPQTFLFDEPLSNLDAKLRLEARSFLKHLQRSLGVTSLYVTHDQSEALALATRIAVMEHGRIAQIGTPAEVYRTPASTFVASFIGNPPMNLLPCKVDLGEGKIHVATGAFDISSTRERFGTRAANAAHVGFRAEKVLIPALTGAAAPSTPIPASLYTVQPLGGETLITLRVGDQEITARLFGDDTPDLPSEVPFYVGTEHLFLYDEDGKILT
jgi:ABC-type sugar transport system ATPase subunit